MAQGRRPDRVGEQIRQYLAEMLAREVHDPGIGFVTITRVSVSADLQNARVHYTLLGDEAARRDAERALARVTPFLRRQLGARMRLRRVPDLRFAFDQSVEHQDRIERILHELADERQARDAAADDGGAPEAADEPPDTPDGSGGHS